MTIIVSVGEPESTTTVGEMVAIEEIEIGTIGEMITDAVKLDEFVPGASAKAKAMAEACGDAAPEFPVVRAEEGWSNSNRLWDGEMLDSIASQVNTLEPVAHLGHIKDEDEATAFPQPQTTWLQATTKMEPSQMKDRKGEMVKAIYIAGYNYADAPVRKLYKQRAVKGFSWWGRARQVPVPGKGVHVKVFNLKTIDWARKHAEGLPSASVLTIAREMEGGNMDKPLSAVTPEEFKKENPNGHALIVAEAKAEADTTIGEMEEKVKAADAAVTMISKIRTALGLADDADPFEAITKMVSKLGEEAKALVQKHLDKVLTAKIPDEKQRKVVMGLLPVGEMVTAAKDLSDDEAVEKLVGEMTDKSFNDDDNIKYIVGEMQPAGARRREEFNGGGSADDATKAYGMTKTAKTL